jgi:hypothetical protein
MKVGEFEKFRLKVQEILNFEWFCPWKLNYIKSFEKEKLVLVV